MTVIDYFKERWEREYKFPLPATGLIELDHKFVSDGWHGLGYSARDGHRLIHRFFSASPTTEVMADGHSWPMFVGSIPELMTRTRGVRLHPQLPRVIKYYLERRQHVVERELGELQDVAQPATRRLQDGDSGS